MTLKFMRVYPISSPEKGYIPLVPVTFRKFMDILILPLVHEDLHLVVLDGN